MVSDGMFGVSNAMTRGQSPLVRLRACFFLVLASGALGIAGVEGEIYKGDYHLCWSSFFNPLPLRSDSDFLCRINLYQVTLQDHSNMPSRCSGDSKLISSAIPPSTVTGPLPCLGTVGLSELQLYKTPNSTAVYIAADPIANNPTPGDHSENTANETCPSCDDTDASCAGPTAGWAVIKTRIGFPSHETASMIQNAAPLTKQRIEELTHTAATENATQYYEINGSAEPVSISFTVDASGKVSFFAVMEGLGPVTSYTCQKA